MRGATLSPAFAPVSAKYISIHAPHAGCDQFSASFLLADGRFQSTHPMRGATSLRFNCIPLCHISIHAPHAGCDDVRHQTPCHLPYFNPRTPCGVRLKAILVGIDPWVIFQSTHPMRGATNRIYVLLKSLPYFNPRTPCGVRRFWVG